MLKEVQAYGAINRVAGDDVISITEITPTGSVDRNLTLKDFKFVLGTVQDPRYTQEVTLEGTFDLTELDENVLELLDITDAIFIKTLQIYVSETITVSGGSSITGVGVTLGDPEEEVAIGRTALTAGSELNYPVFTTAATPLVLMGIDGGDELGTGTISGGEIKVRLTYSKLIPISSNYTVI
jgi:hypothetical protein